MRLPVKGASAVLCAALLVACSTPLRKFAPEEFGSTTTHARNYAVVAARTCEAARRALLSQGFLIAVANADRVNGRKNFQPDSQIHVELEFHVVCAPDGQSGKKSIAFVNALQDSYTLKKSSNSASVGVGPIGSLSLPFSSSDDSMVRVASETITSTAFYDRFFVLLLRYLAADSDRVDPKVDEAVKNLPSLQPPALAPASPASSAAASPAAPAAPP